MDWWLTDAVQEPRRERTGLNLMLLNRDEGRIADLPSPSNAAGGIPPIERVVRSCERDGQQVTVPFDLVLASLSR